jgi:hypothetical protein
VRLERDWVQSEHAGVQDLVGDAEVELEQDVVRRANNKLVADEGGKLAQNGLLFSANFKLEELKKGRDKKRAVLLLLAVLDVHLSVGALEDAEVGLDHDNAGDAPGHFLSNLGHEKLRFVDEVYFTIATLDVERGQLVDFLALVQVRFGPGQRFAALVNNLDHLLERLGHKLERAANVLDRGIAVVAVLHDQVMVDGHNHRVLLHVQHVAVFRLHHERTPERDFVSVLVNFDHVVILIENDALVHLAHLLERVLKPDLFGAVNHAVLLRAHGVLDDHVLVQHQSLAVNHSARGPNWVARTHLGAVDE